jgi:hypothetical protein
LVPAAQTSGVVDGELQAIRSERDDVVDVEARLHHPGRCVAEAEDVTDLVGDQHAEEIIVATGRQQRMRSRSGPARKLRREFLDARHRHEGAARAAIAADREAAVVAIGCQPSRGEQRDDVRIRRVRGRGRLPAIADAKCRGDTGRGEQSLGDARSALQCRIVNADLGADVNEQGRAGRRAGLG